MVTARWPRERAVSVTDPLAVDELDPVDVLVLEGVAAADDGRLQWCARAPCVVVGDSGAEQPSTAVDVVVGGADTGTLARLIDAVEARPAASRMLVDVLRTVPRLPPREALVMESLAYSTLQAGSEHRAWLRVRQPPAPRSFHGPPLSVARADGELRVTLNRPENRNAFSAAMRDALVEALTAAEVDASIQRVVLDAAGPSFCSGGDLTEFGTSTDVVRAHEIRTLRSVGAIVARMAPKTRVVVHGSCVGAGVELSAFASRVVARPGTTFRLPEIAMGLIPGAGGTVSITSRIGRQSTALLALLGDELAADAALDLGLVDEIAG